MKKEQQTGTLCISRHLAQVEKDFSTLRIVDRAQSSGAKSLEKSAISSFEEILKKARVLNTLVNLHVSEDWLPQVASFEDVSTSLQLSIDGFCRDFPAATSGKKAKNSPNSELLKILVSQIRMFTQDALNLVRRLEELQQHYNQRPGLTRAG